MSVQDVTLPGSYRLTVKSNGVVQSSQDVPVSSTWTFHEVRTDRVRTRKPVGWLPPKPYQLDTSTFRMPSGRFSTLNGSQSVEWLGDLGVAVGSYFDEMQLLNPSGLANAAVIDALLALKDQSINLGVAFAEMQQTADLIGSTAKRVGQAYRSFKQGKFKQGMNHLGASGKKVPNSWLEAQYAWKPLLSDVYGATEALADGPRTGFIITAKGTSRQQLDNERLQVFSDSSRWIKSHRSSGAFVRLDYIPSNIFLDAMSRVGMTNPLEVIWEKVPFSFVVDWFYPAGNWLRTLDAAIGWEFKGGSCSVRHISKCKVKEGPMGTPAVFQGGKFSGSYKRVKLDRTVYSSSPLPYPPRFKNPVSLGHAANGLSLLATCFGR